MSGPDHLGLHVAERIHTLRTKQGGTVHALARAASTHHGHLRHVESGFTSPTVTTLANVGAALGVRPSDLLNTGQSDHEAIYELLRNRPDLVSDLRTRLRG